MPQGAGVPTPPPNLSIAAVTEKVKKHNASPTARRPSLKKQFSVENKADIVASKWMGTKVSPSPNAGVPVSKKAQPPPQSHHSPSSPRDSMELIEDTVERYLSDDAINPRKPSKKQRRSGSTGTSVGLRGIIPTTGGAAAFGQRHSWGSEDDEDDEHHHHHHHRDRQCSIHKPKTRGFNPCISKNIIRVSLDSWCTFIGVWHVVFSILHLSLNILWQPILTPAFLEAVKYDSVIVTGVLLEGLSGLFLIFGVFLRNRVLAIMHVVLISMAFVLMLAWSTLLLHLKPVSHTELLRAIQYCHMAYCLIIVYLGICALGWSTQLKSGPADENCYCTS